MTLVRELRLEEFAVQAGDVRDIDPLGALQLAGTRVGAVAEAQFVHLRDHRLGTAMRLRTALRKQGEGTDAGSDEEHRRTVLTRSHTGTTAHAGRCIHALLRLVVRDQDVVGILRRTGPDRNEAAGLEDLIEGAAVHDEVLDDRETGAAPRLHRDGGAIFEMAHEELAGRHMIVRTVCASVNIQATGTADAFAAVVVEGDGTAALATAFDGDRIASLPDQLLVENIKHLQERSVLLDTGNMVGLEMTLGLGVLLTPYFQIEFHLA